MGNFQGGEGKRTAPVTERAPKRAATPATAARRFTLRIIKRKENIAEVSFFGRAIVTALGVTFRFNASKRQLGPYEQNAGRFFFHGYRV